MKAHFRLHSATTKYFGPFVITNQRIAFLHSESGFDPPLSALTIVSHNRQYIGSGGTPDLCDCLSILESLPTQEYKKMRPGDFLQNWKILRNSS